MKLKSKRLAATFFFCVMILFSCAGQRYFLFIPEAVENIEFESPVDIENIIETQNGPGNENLPPWLAAFFYGGIGEIERMALYQDRYCFIGRNTGTNFDALVKWAANYSVTHDFTRMAAERIKDKMFSAAVLYPDDEYGAFFEMMVKNAFDTVFPNARIEDTFWIKTINRETLQTTFEFYIFISIDRLTMQNVINDMITRTRAAVSSTRAQNAAINRLQQTFFEGF